ncbi:MAG: hypothetical protein H6Q42_4404, partial [Deltaproteobacteria bacterium]|nr:hypothetical protein [Deltaproteobacteria bacterium]
MNKMFVHVAVIAALITLGFGPGTTEVFGADEKAPGKVSYPKELVFRA